MLPNRQINLEPQLGTYFLFLLHTPLLEDVNTILDIFRKLFFTFQEKYAHS